MAHDVFISYSSKDQELANAVCTKLEEAGIRCWIAPRDIIPGATFGEAIISAINVCKIVVIIFSSHSNCSGQVLNEIERAVSKSKIIVPMRIENITPSGDMELFLSRRHWLDAMTPPMQTHIATLSDTIHRLLNRQIEKAEPVPPPEMPNPSAQIESTVIKQVAAKIEPEPKLPTTPCPQVLKAITKEPEVQSDDGQDSSNSRLFLFAKNAICFDIGFKDSPVRSFYYVPGTAVQFIKKGEIDSTLPYGGAYFQLPNVGGKDIWLTGFAACQVDANDKRVFFKITESGQVGYLVDRDVEEIEIVENMLGSIKIKLDQIISITVKQDEMSVLKKDSGVLTGSLRIPGVGPCLVTCDSKIALIDTTRVRTLTLKRIAEDELERPPLIHPRIYWDRSQLKFRVTSTAAVGCFNERVQSGYIEFAEQSLGSMGISIPQIKRLTVQLECKEAPIVVETFLGNVYRGTCPERFNYSGTMISFNEVKKNFVLEAFDREAPDV